MIDSMKLYSCSVCGNTLSGMEWEEHAGQLKEFKCPSCQHMLNEDELYDEDGPIEN